MGDTSNGKKSKLKRYTDFHSNVKNESLKTFPKKAKKSKSDSEDKPEGVDRTDALSYDEELNRRILAKEKDTDYSDNQTNIDTSKREIPTVDPNVYPNDKSEYNDKNHKPSKGIVNLDEDDDKKSKSKSKKVQEDVEFYGKVAKFPKDVEASKAINFMEKVKLSKNKIWYVMVEKQDNELQMVKYQMKKGINLSKFVNDLKTYYIDLYKDNEQVLEKVKNIQLAGDKNGNYSAIKNIPSVEVNGKKMITNITEDLIKILSK